MDAYGILDAYGIRTAPTRFARTAEEAVAYAKAHDIPYQLFEPHVPTPKPKAYSDNFKFDRKVPWSH